MNFQILKDEKKPLLKRREISGKLGYEARTPSRLEAKKELAKQLNVKEELVVIKKIVPSVGTQAARFEAFIYEDEPTMKAVEAGHAIRKNSPAEKKQEPVQESAEKTEE